MNQGIPNPLRKALARQTSGDVHPSPDVLTSFMERTLTPVEGEVVTQHLAQCAECREIVFLASDAVEDEVADSRELVAAAAARRVATTPVYATHAFAEPPRAEKSPSRWPIRTRWAVALTTAALLVSSGAAVKYWRATSGHQTPAFTVASNRPTLRSPQMQQPVETPSSQVAAGKPAAPQPLAESAPHPVIAARAKKISPETTLADMATNQSAPAPPPQPAAQAAASPAAGAAVGGASDATTTEVGHQNSVAQSEAVEKKGAAPKNESAQSLQLKQRAPVLFGKAATSTHAVSAVRPQWRIGPNGQLERFLAADQWTRVLDDQPVAFHAVGVIGNDVWAGGNGGALFHSFDRGEHWSKVPLAANSNIETGAIASIRFDDPQHGIVASDSGTRWATTDGGVTWTKQ
jgi:Photosynthesis system II assembly factor YCF48